MQLAMFKEHDATYKIPQPYEQDSTVLWTRFSWLLSDLRMVPPMAVNQDGSIYGSQSSLLISYDLNAIKLQLSCVYCLWIVVD